MRCLPLLVVSFAIFTLHVTVAFKKFEKGALAYLLLKGLQPKPQASEMMVMLPAGMDLNEIKVPMMMLVMPVTATTTTPMAPATSMMAANMMASGMMPQMATNGDANGGAGGMNAQQMMMTQMMQQMIAADSANGNKVNNDKHGASTAGPAGGGNLMSMMMAANGAGANGSSGPAINTDSIDVPMGDNNSKNVIEALARYESAVHHGRAEHVHLPVGLVHAAHADHPHAHRHHGHHHGRA